MTRSVVVAKCELRLFEFIRSVCRLGLRIRWMTFQTSVGSFEDSAVTMNCLFNFLMVFLSYFLLSCISVIQPHCLTGGCLWIA